MTTGATLLGVSMLWSAVVLDQLAYGWLVPGYVVAGVGLAMVMTPASTDAMNSAPARYRGEASGVMQTVRQVGGTIGLAIMGTVAATVQSNRLTDFADQVGASPSQRAFLERALAEAQGNPSALRGVPAGTAEAARDALTSGISAAYYVAAGALLAVALLAGLLLRRVGAADAPEAAPARVPVTPGAHPALRLAGHLDGTPDGPAPERP